MYCPNCRTEYRDGFARCSDCDAALVSMLEPQVGQPDLVKVFETSQPSVIPVVESLLRGAGIEFMAKNGRLHSTVPGANFALGPVQYWVLRGQAADARSLLEELEGANESARA